jgi:hypothetical protein
MLYTLNLFLSHMTASLGEIPCQLASYFLCSAHVPLRDTKKSTLQNHEMLVSGVISQSIRLYANCGSKSDKVKIQTKDLIEQKKKIQEGIHPFSSAIDGIGLNHSTIWRFPWRPYSN